MLHNSGYLKKWNEIKDDEKERLEEKLNRKYRKKNKKENIE